MWFKEMGYTAVFFKQLVTQLTVGIPTFLVVTGMVMLYLHHLRKSYFSKIASSEATDMKKLKKTTNILAVVFGAIATFMTVVQLWFEILKFANSSDFDIKDPLFHLDVSFYLFKLEFLTQLNEILIGVIVGFVILTVIYYIILMTVRTPDVFKEEVPPQRAGGRSRRTLYRRCEACLSAADSTQADRIRSPNSQRHLPARSLRRSRCARRNSLTTAISSS